MSDEETLYNIQEIEVASDREQAFDLIRRLNQLACALPSEDSIRDPRTREAAIRTGKLVLAELDKTKQAIDAALGIPHRPIRKSGSQ